MFDPTSVKVRGPLTAHMSGFWSALRGERYAPDTSAGHLRVAADFSRWLEDHRLDLRDLSEERIASFLRDRRRRGHRCPVTRQGVRPLLEYLRGCGVPVQPTPRVDSTSDVVLGTYAEYLASERHVCAGTIAVYVKTAREFGGRCFGSGDPKWNQLTAASVVSFAMCEARHLTIAYSKHKLSELRSFLRFLHVAGHVPVGLVGCVPAVAGWRLASVPPALEPRQIERLLGVVSDQSAMGRRDGAIVRLLLRLALRAGDVASLDLDDVDWRAGEVTVRGKGKRESRLPLPHDVGKALAAYLRCRPPARTRRLFVRSRAPFGALSSGGVITVASRALRRAGITAGGAHLLRHTAATQMLRHGASLPEIAHVLRHRHLDTTAMYAKVDLASLQTVARPWPQAAV